MLPQASTAVCLYFYTFLILLESKKKFRRRRIKRLKFQKSEDEAAAPTNAYIIV